MHKFILAVLIGSSFISFQVVAKPWNNVNQPIAGKSLSCFQTHNFQVNDNVLKNILKCAYYRNLDLLILRDSNHCFGTSTVKFINCQDEKIVWKDLSFNIISLYVDLRNKQQQVQLINKNIENQKMSISLIEDLLQRGSSDSISLNQAQADLNKLHVQLMVLNEEIEKNIRALSISINSCPESLKSTLNTASDLPQVPYHAIPTFAKNQVGIRADIKKINLVTCLEPTTSNKLQLRKTYLSAYEEILNTKVALEYSQKKLSLLKQNFFKISENFNLISDLHKRGLKDSFELLNANNQMTEAQIEYIQSKADVILNFVKFNQAMGKEITFCSN